MITDSELKGLAMQGLNMAKRDLEQGQLCCVLASYHEGETIHRMRRIEEILVEMLGQDWLNKGHCKEAGFNILRMANREHPCDAIIFVSAINQFRQTEAFKRLSPEQQKFILDAGHDRHHQAVKEGLFEIQDCISALAQTASRVCVYLQVVDNRHNFEGPPQVELFDQRVLQGRLKLFGEES